MSMIDICRFPPPTLSPSAPSHMTSTASPSSPAWWRKGADPEENRASSTSNLYQPLASGDRIPPSLNQPEARPADIGSSADLPASKDAHQSLQNEIGAQSSNDSINNTSGKRSRDWDRDVEATASSTADEPRIKRRVTMSSVREHENLYPGNRVEELSDDAGAGSAEEADGPAQFGHSKTPSDPSSERRKTKRFRLTHNQTRFLMSEFTRQAHPDAAHRERLSREIPGLSPRQVQVWFQNRRAKLKRLTSQDRERVLKSRALPEDFDIGQVLNQPYSSRAADHSPLPALHAPGSSFSGVSMPKPLQLNATNRPNGDEHPLTTPPSAASIYGSYGPSPTSLNPLETSPLSRSDTRSLGSAPRVRERASSQTDIGSLARSQSFSSAYPRSWLPVQRLQLQQTEAKVRDNSLGSPLRTSISYSEGTARHENSGSSIPGMTLGNGRSNAEPNTSSNDDGAPHTAPLLSGLSYQNEPVPSTQSQSYTHQTQDDWRVNFNVGSNYRHVPAMSSAPLSVPQDYQYSSFSQPFNFDSFYTYNQNNSSSINMPSSNLRSDVEYEAPNNYNFNADDELNKPSGLPPSRH